MKNAVKSQLLEKGSKVTVYGVPCRVFRVHPLGTVDVEAEDGTDRYWRLSGLFGQTGKVST